MNKVRYNIPGLSSDSLVQDSTIASILSDLKTADHNCKLNYIEAALPWRLGRTFSFFQDI